MKFIKNLLNRIKKPLYYECHVTILPVYGEELKNFELDAKVFGFKVAKLLMQKNREDLPERSNKDCFATSRDRSFEAMELRMNKFLGLLECDPAFKVIRYKIEAVVLDVKEGQRDGEIDLVWKRRQMFTLSSERTIRFIYAGGSIEKKLSPGSYIAEDNKDGTFTCVENPT